MKYTTFFLLVIYLASVFSCTKTPKKAKVHFEKDTINFTIQKGQIYEASFKFKNIGNDSLRIKTIHTDCGCTVANFPKYPIAPNTLSNIEIRFDSNSKDKEKISQTIVVESNTEPILSVLVLEGHILK